MLNLAMILRESATARPGAPALLYAGETVTYAELDALSDRVAEGLVARGRGARRPDRPPAAHHPRVPGRVLRHPEGRRASSYP